MNIDKLGDIEDPSGCFWCGAIAGCCDKYPKCPGNPDYVACPNCESEAVSCFMEVDSFVYGVEAGTELHALVPVFSCGDCGERWTNWIGERNREEAVAIHLGNDVEKVRAMYRS